MVNCDSGNAASARPDTAYSQRSSIARSTDANLEVAQSIDQVRAIRSILASSSETRKAALIYFRKFDVNNDRLLQRDELEKCFRAIGSEFGISSIDSRQISDLVPRLDANGALDEKAFEDFFRRLLTQRLEIIQAEIKVTSCEESRSPGDTYDVMKRLGEGSPGIAHLVSDRRSGDTKVLKKLIKQNAETQLQQEIRDLMMLDHPHIMKLFEYYEDENNIFMVTEAAVGGDLAQVIQKLHRSGYLVGERWSAAVMQQVLEAIAFCHELQIMHKDLKAESIMLLKNFDFETYPHAVIADLGFAGMCQTTPENGAQRVVAGGTPVAMAPEVWRAYMGHGGFGFKSDMYSLGVVLFQLLTGTLPFQCSSGEAVEWLRLIACGPPTDRLETYCSKFARKLVVKMLAADPIRRPTARHALRDKWFFQI